MFQQRREKVQKENLIGERKKQRNWINEMIENRVTQESSHEKTSKGEKVLYIFKKWKSKAGY
jgi:hypothetical protein